MTDVKFMNVWRSLYHDHQWTDDGALLDRELADDVAKSVEEGGGIRRVGVLHVRMKPAALALLNPEPTPAVEVVL